LDNQPQKHPLREGKLETELLANERTFLAWVRTSIAVIGLGFVVARLGLWLHELASKVSPQIQTKSTGFSLPLGEIIIGLGGLLTALAGWRYHIVNRAIETGKIKADTGMVVTISIIVVVTAVAIILYMHFASTQTLS
jgi:putative membrane protein